MRYMSLLQLLVTSFLIALSGALAPGPLMAVTMRHGVRNGPWVGLVVSIGHGLVELAMLWALVLGLGKLLALPLATRAIAALGAAVLVWMAWGSLQEARSNAAGWTIDTAASTAPPTGRSSRPSSSFPLFSILAAGVAATATNPYWALWWATIGANYVVLAQTQGLIGLGTFFAGHISADVFCFILFAAMAATGHRLLGQRFYRGLMLALSVFLLVLAVYFARLAFFH